MDAVRTEQAQPSRAAGRNGGDEALAQMSDAELETLVKLVEERVVENLTQMIERLAQEKNARNE